LSSSPMNSITRDLWMPIQTGTKKSSNYWAEGVCVLLILLWLCRTNFKTSKSSYGCGRSTRTSCATRTTVAYSYWMIVLWRCGANRRIRPFILIMWRMSTLRRMTYSSRLLNLWLSTAYRASIAACSRTARRAQARHTRWPVKSA
jgi:hypothetical protein